MKKKEIAIVIFLGILTLFVIVAGLRYRGEQRLALGKTDYEEVNQTELFEERQLKQEKKKRAKFLAAFDDKREENTVADFLQYVKYAKGDTNVAFYGQIEEDAKWAVDNMTQLAKERAFTEMETHYVSTIDSENENSSAVESLVALKPDVVFYHTKLANTDNEIDEIFATYASMKDSLPEALIVLVTQIPEPSEAEEDESIYQEGIKELMDLSLEYKIPVFNVHDQIIEQLQVKKAEVSSLYDESGILKPETVELFKNLILTNIKELKIDTRTAYILNGEPAEVDIVIEVYPDEVEVESEVLPEPESESEEVIVPEMESLPPVEEPAYQEEESVEVEEEWIEQPQVETWEPEVSDDYEEDTWTPPASVPAPQPQPESKPDPDPKPEPEPVKPVPPVQPSNPVVPEEPVEPTNPVPPPPPLESDWESY
ncbi:hypothetical protein [Jeotgalibaca dankookensis]|uniref:hypothetical protein n=1 Tax=Jeotgalibaca dankookensis TaxID=708126 RepID=UPI0007839519|nr:hypothetical protein [Jeotgalibaca dankookensis]